MTLKEKIAYSRKRPKTYVDDMLPKITYSKEDDIEEIICLMMATAYQDMPAVFYKLVSCVEALPDLHDHLDYMYYYHLSLASFYKHSGNSPNAIEHCLRSNDIAYRIGDNCAVVQSYRFLSSVYLNNKDYDNATYYSTCAIKELPLCDDFVLCANVYNLYGVVLVELEKYDYAVQAYDNAFDSIKRIESYEDDMMYYLLHLNYGEVLMLMGDIKQSEIYYLKAIELSEKYNHDYTFGDMLLMLVDYYKKSGNYEQACTYYDKYFNRNTKAEPVSVLLNEKKGKAEIKKELSQMKQLRDTNQILLKRLAQMQQLTDKSDVKVHLELQNRLTNALENDHIITYFQGKWSLKQNRYVGAEALIRWQDGSVLVPPVAFIPKVEDTEMIIELSKVVIQDSIKMCKYIVSTYHPDFLISINIAPYQLEHQDLASFIQGELLLNKLEAKHIEIEITERSFINQTPNIINQLQKLQELGLALSLDDFGTGYSSLSYIKDYNFDCIKLDKSLLDHVTTDLKAFGLLSGILSMFQALNIDTVVEGIETLEQEQLLQALNCDYLQGYYYNRPMIGEQFLKNMESDQKVSPEIK
jgi:EAL domain-containing protein (putative c-di-GMP-specific phosphodiesterase class I)